MSASEHAQHEFVHRLIDWKRVRQRLEKYPAIARAFPLEKMKRHCEKPPYYCHFMSWRLGVYDDESTFERLESLLHCAENLPDWKHEKSLLGDRHFAVYWSLAWQLQVAEHLCSVGTDVRWSKSGPDLSVEIDGKRLYVECYSHRKSFALLSFLEEILWEIDSSVRIYYDYCLPFQLPRNSDETRFLHEILRPFLEPAYLADAKERSKQENPVVLHKDSSSSLHVYVEDDGNGGAYVPGRMPNRTGNPKTYVETVLKEAVNNKQESNDLSNRRPNLLAVNFLLSKDFQVAKMLPSRVQSPCLPDIAPNIDALAVSVVGIDEQLTREKFRVAVRSEKIEDGFWERIASSCTSNWLRSC